jgi:hypothetical protein
MCPFEPEADVRGMPFANPDPHARTRSSTLIKTLATLGLLIVLGVIAASSAVAAFRPSTSAEHINSQGFRLQSRGSGHAMFEAPTMAPGETLTSRMEISYKGSTPGSLHLYGATTGTRLARSLRLQVSREGKTLYRGTLAGFPDSYEEAVVDPRALGGSTSATYRFEVTLMDGTEPPAGTTSQTFIWEARGI